MEKLSSYAENFSDEAEPRHREKTVLIRGLDPFAGNLGVSLDTMPPLDASDLIAYLVLETNFVTVNQFKAFKSLEAYNQFVCDWIKDVRTRRTAGKYVTVCGKPSECVASVLSSPAHLFHLVSSCMILCSYQSPPFLMTQEHMIPP